MVSVAAAPYPLIFTGMNTGGNLFGDHLVSHNPPEGLEGILVGHSLAGIMAPAIAEHVPQRISHIINLDGVVPVDGKSFKDLLPDFWAGFQQRGRANDDEAWSPPVPEWFHFP